MVTKVGNGQGDLDEAFCISHSANTLEKGINLTILPSAMSN